MRVAIHQPNYAPWCGYFAKARHCDIFVFLDDVQMPVGRSFVYRTSIRNQQETQWLSVPTRSNTGDCINAVEFSDPKWPRKHVGTLRGVYARAPHFKEVFALLEPLYQSPGDTLSRFNMQMIRTVTDYLGLSCRFEVSSALQPEGQSDDRLISLAHLVGADTYVSGKGGQNYQEPAKFAAAGITLEVHEYQPVPYSQIHGDFVAGLSILDALFHLGREAIQLLEYPQVVPR